MGNKKEISFGAFDSELMHQEIYIPKGFEATIEGNKIILTKTKSEDEKIRKEIISIIKSYRESCITEGNHRFNDCITWLEKQGNLMKALQTSNARIGELVEENYYLKEQLEKQDEYAENNDDDSDTDFTIYYPLKNGEGIYECIPYSFYGTLSSFSEDKDLIDFLHLCFYTEEECNEWIKQNESTDTCDSLKSKEFPASEKQDFGYFSEPVDKKPIGKIESKFNVGDWVVDKNGTVLQILSYNNCIYKHTNGYSSKMFEDEWRLWDITKDAKDGDVLAEDSCLFIIKKLNDDFSADTYCVLYDDGDYENNCHLCFDYKGTYPATKEQCEMLFNRIKMENYKWDPEKKELKDIKPKFKEGDWVVDEEDNSVHQIKLVIENVTYGGFSYDLTDNGYFPCTKSNYHLWTIKDAKDGNILIVPSVEGSEHSEQIFIFKEIKDRDYAKNTVEYYCRVCDNEFYVNKTGFMGQSDDYFVPATKEQRDLLFQKMNEAGYKWDGQNKKVIKIANNNSIEEDNNYDPYKIAVQHIIETCYEYEDVIDPDTYAAEFYDEIMNKCNNAIEYDNKHPKKKALNVDDLNNIQSITKILNNAKKYYYNDDEIIRGIEWVNSLKNI